MISISSTKCMSALIVEKIQPAATIENSMEVPQKTKNRVAI